MIHTLFASMSLAYTVSSRSWAVWDTALSDSWTTAWWCANHLGKENTCSLNNRLRLHENTRIDLLVRCQFLEVAQAHPVDEQRLLIRHFSWSLQEWKRQSVLINKSDAECEPEAQRCERSKVGPIDPARRRRGSHGNFSVDGRTAQLLSVNIVARARYFNKQTAGLPRFFALFVYLVYVTMAACTVYSTIM